MTKPENRDASRRGNDAESQRLRDMYDAHFEQDQEATNDQPAD